MVWLTFNYWTTWRSTTRWTRTYEGLRGARKFHLVSLCLQISLTVLLGSCLGLCVVVVCFVVFVGLVVGFFLLGKFDLNHRLIPVVDRPCLALVRQCRKKKAKCPWHRGPGSATDSNSLRVVHMICDKDDNTSVVHLRGFLDHLLKGGNFWLFHVCTRQQILNLGKRFLPSHSSAELFVSTLSEGTLAGEQSDVLTAPFRQASLPPEYFRHFFIKTGGQASALDVWLPRGQC